MHGECADCNQDARTQGKLFIARMGIVAVMFMSALPE